MKAHVALVGALLGWSASSSFATVVALSNFSLDADGWLAKNGASDIKWIASGGSPGAFVDAFDQGSGLWFFAAPSKFVIQAPKAYGGVLNYQLRSVSASGPIAGSYADVMLVASDNSYVSFFGGFSPTSSWQSFSIPFVAGSSWVFGATDGSVQPATADEFKSVLSNLSGFRIRGDYFAKGEITGLDTVVLSASAVPEPAPVALGVGGGLFLAFMSARRRRSPASK